jgi:KilA-N domain
MSLPVYILNFRANDTRFPSTNTNSVKVSKNMVGSFHSSSITDLLTILQVMRRRHDDWINATHILKAAGFDKPARTRILEREVQKEVHEKVQGGYGKYQGRRISRE